MEEVIGSERRDVDVGIPVVVVVRYGAALPVHSYCEAGLPRDIREGAVLVVVIERWVGCTGCVAGPVHGVDQQDVLPTVVVVVEEADAAAHGFREILFPEGAA